MLIKKNRLIMSMVIPNKKLSTIIVDIVLNFSWDMARQRLLDEIVRFIADADILVGVIKKVFRYPFLSSKHRCSST